MVVGGRQVVMLDGRVSEMSGWGGAIRGGLEIFRVREGQRQVDVVMWSMRLGGCEVGR